MNSIRLLFVRKKNRRAGQKQYTYGEQNDVTLAVHVSFQRLMI